MSGPRIKVCGVTRAEDALLAAELGADFLGLNFWPRSPRRVGLEEARAIADAVRGRVRVVGVFVNPCAEEVALAEGVGLDLLQFHGDETPAHLAPFAARSIKALRAGERPGDELFAAYPDVWGFLVEPRRQGYGGSGEAWGYAAAADLPTRKPVFLAGGIGPENVRSVVAAARPWGVDVCSRVEARPGVKDPARLRRLFEEVRDARLTVA
jgi:phosphoribosylanthranilate isomerase